MHVRERVDLQLDRDIPERPYGRSLPMLLMRTREAVMCRIRPHLRIYGLTDQQWRILRALASGNTMELTDLSLRSLIALPSLSRTVPLLTNRGLLHRECDSRDRRWALISLSDGGQELFAEVSLGSPRIYEQLRSEIGEENSERLSTLLMHVILSEPAGEQLDRDIPERSYGRSLPMLLMRSRETVMRRIDCICAVMN